MTTSEALSIEQLAHRATAEVLDSIIRKGEALVAVDSPPGAGKTTLVENVVAAAQHCGLRVAVAAPRAAQTIDITRRILAHYPTMPIDLWLAKDRELPADLATHPDVISPGVPSWRPLQGGSRVVIGTVKMFAAHVSQLKQSAFDVLITDEAYQVTYTGLAPLLHLADQRLIVGDPGQLPPLVRADTARFEAARYKVHWSAPRELLRRFPDVRRVQLPATRRLPQDSVDLIQPAFYEKLPFVSSAVTGDRRIQFAASGMRDPIDRALDMLSAGHTMVGILLPSVNKPLGNVDDAVALVMANVVERLGSRGAEWQEKRRLQPGDVGCIDPHVASGAAVRQGLRRQGLSISEVLVDTPEIWQGLERPIMVVKHPLSGQQHLNRFSLESGRWCVSLSRHLLGCIIVGRDGIGESLERHSHNCADRPMGAEDTEWSGWKAHFGIWTDLERRGCLVRL